MPFQHRLAIYIMDTTSKHPRGINIKNVLKALDDVPKINPNCPILMTILININHFPKNKDNKQEIYMR